MGVPGEELRVRVLVAVVLVAAAGCAPRGLRWRPPLDQQLRTEALELVPAGWAPSVSWMSSHHLPVGGGLSSIVLKPTPELQAAAQSSAAEGAALLVDRAAAAGVVNGVSLVRSARPAPASPDEPPVEEPFRGRPAFALSLDTVQFFGPAAPGAPIVVRFGFGARELTRPYAPSGEGQVEAHFARHQAFVATAATDPIPRPFEAWLADGGRLLREATARAAAWAAPRLVGELVETTGGRAPWKTCGPAPASPPRGATVTAGPLRLEWEPWTPEASTPGGHRVTYDVRAFRLEAGLPEPVLSLDGVADPAATIPDVEAGATYGWAVRATLELPDGRRFHTAWSRTAVPGEVCAGELAPWSAPRFFVAGEVARGAGAAVEVPPPDPRLPLPPLERRRALAGIQVAPLAAPFATVSWKADAPATGAHAGRGAGEGALGGVKASAACGFLLPVCLVVMPAVGALVGGVAGAVEARGDVPDEEARLRAWRGLRDAVSAPPLQQGLEAEVRAALGPIAATPGQEPDATLEVAVVRASFVGGRRGWPAMAVELELGARLVLPDGAAGYRAVPAGFPTPLLLHLWLGDEAALLHGTLGGLVAEAAPRLVASVLEGPDGPLPPDPPPADPASSPDLGALQQ